jgi:hypothetical protein
MVRSPLVRLGEPDPIVSMETIRAEDPELSNIRELFACGSPTTLVSIRPTRPRVSSKSRARTDAHDYSPRTFKLFLQRVAGDKDGVFSQAIGVVVTQD